MSHDHHPIMETSTVHDHNMMSTHDHDSMTTHDHNSMTTEHDHSGMDSMDHMMMVCTTCKNLAHWCLPGNLNWKRIHCLSRCTSTLGSKRPSSSSNGPSTRNGPWLAPASEYSWWPFFTKDLNISGSPSSASKLRKFIWLIVDCVAGKCCIAASTWPLTIAKCQSRAKAAVAAQRKHAPESGQFAFVESFLFYNP